MIDVFAAKTFVTFSRPCRPRAAWCRRAYARPRELDLEPAEVEEFHRALTSSTSRSSSRSPPPCRISTSRHRRCRPTRSSSSSRTSARSVSSPAPARSSSRSGSRSATCARSRRWSRRTSASSSRSRSGTATRDSRSSIYPGRNDRPRPRGREVRLAPRLQVLDVRDVVDQPGRHARGRRQGPHDSHARPHRRQAQQDRSRRAEASRRAAPRPDVGGDRARSRHPRARRSSDHAERAGAGLARAPRRRRGGHRVRPAPHRRALAASGRRRRRRRSVPSCSTACSPRSTTASGGSSSCATASRGDPEDTRRGRPDASTSPASGSARSRTRASRRSARWQTPPARRRLVDPCGSSDGVELRRGRRGLPLRAASPNIAPG